MWSKSQAVAETTRRFAGARFLVPSRSFQCSFRITPWKFAFPRLGAARREPSKSRAKLPAMKDLQIDGKVQGSDLAARP